MDEESRFPDEILRLRYAQNQNDRMFDERERRREDFDLRKELLNNNVSTAVADSVATAWVRHYASGLVTSNDRAYAMVRDPTDGSIYVIGKSDSTFTGYDYLTIKYNTAGELVWAVRYNGPGNSMDEPNAITIGRRRECICYGWAFFCRWDGLHNNKIITDLNVSTDREYNTPEI